MDGIYNTCQNNVACLKCESVHGSVPTGTGKPVEDGTEQMADGYGTYERTSVE